MASAQQVQAVPGISRREFLYYIWAASIAVFSAETLGMIIWFAIPRIREGEFGGVFSLNGSELPGINEVPGNYSTGRFWLVNLDTDQGNARMYIAPDESEPIKGVAAIYKVCTHLGCIYAWNTASDRFECPCHGSKYRLDGRRIQSPAPRTLDRFEVTLVLANGDTVVSEQEEGTDFYLPVPIPEGQEVAQIRINTGAKKDGTILPILQEFPNDGKPDSIA